MEFKKGDIVEWCGVIGEVIEFDNDSLIPIKAKFAEGFERFTHAGFLFPWHREPSLKLVRRPKVKKTFWFFSFKIDDCNRNRGTSGLYSERSALGDIYNDMEDRQIHSIDIEV